jgi:hypothetical protein
MEMKMQMTGAHFARRCLGALLVSLAIGAAQVHAQAKTEFTPEVGQPGKDVVWVPSPDQLVDKMLDMAKVTPSDFLMDLGSGDGRTVIAAAKRGVRAMGVEYNPDMVALSRRNAEKAGATGMASFVEGDIFQTDLTKATVITLFLLPDLNVKLRPTLLGMKPGTRVVSNTFRMGDWSPDEAFELGCGSYCTAYLWIVPARVAGQWKSAQGDLEFKQEYQTLSGLLGAAPISASKLAGDQISFSANGMQFSGRVAGDSIEGSFKSATGNGPWKATRIK